MKKFHHTEPVGEETEDVLTPNSALYERQLSYLAVVKTYLEQQLEQVEKAIEEITTQLVHENPEE